jgi:hypothetical protein
MMWEHMVLDEEIDEFEWLQMICIQELQWAMILMGVLFFGVLEEW